MPAYFSTTGAPRQAPIQVQETTRIVSHPICFACGGQSERAIKFVRAPSTEWVSPYDFTVCLECCQQGAALLLQANAAVEGVE